MTDIAPPTGQLPLAGPAEKHDPARWPARGDLAHIALAGRCFVSHYAVPMPHAIAANGAILRRTAAVGSETLAELAPGALFDVLDMAGGWCWGQVSGDVSGETTQAGPHAGLVGYLPREALA